MNNIIKKREYLVAWLVWMVGFIGVFVVLGFIIVIPIWILRYVGIGTDIYMRNLGQLYGIIGIPLSSFTSFVFTVKFMIVRKVKERAKQQIHQRYQKLLEEKGIQLEDSDV